MDTLKNPLENSFTFSVDSVEIADKPPMSLKKAEDLLPNLHVLGKIEDFSHKKKQEQIFVNEFLLQGFIAAVHTAYQSHYPLKLSVSDFLILIGQGLSKHINNNAEELRSVFVNHEGKETIQIERNEFVKGEQNDWSTVFGEFAGEIKKRVKTDIYDVVIDDTSVATPTSRIVSEITLMNAMKSYYGFSLATKCGIPQVTLEGSKKDWELLRTKVKKLIEMNKDDCLKLKWWLEHLVPVVDKICDTAISKVADKEFWSSIYKYKNFSGSPIVSGWITVFFPYLVGGSKYSPDRIVHTNKIPGQVCEVPFEWIYYGEVIPMAFYGGFLGAEYDSEDNSIRPAHFWSVNHREEKK